MFKNIVVLVLFCALGTYSMAQEKWKLVKNQDGIQVFSRPNEVMSFNEFRATMESDATVHQFLSVLYDVEGLTSWAHNVTEASLLSRESETHQVYYAVAKAPWPYKNRDGVYSNKIYWDSRLRTLTVEVELVETYLQQKSEHVRMDGYGFWKFRELSNNKTEVIFQMQIDPGGSIKAWLANMFTTDSPYKTLKKLKKVVQHKKYQNKSYNFIE